MVKVVVYDDTGSVDAESVELIRRVTPEIELFVPAKDQLTEELVNAEIFFGYHSPEVFHTAERLRWIQSTAAGMDAMLDEHVVSQGWMITNASGVHAPQVVETAWALTLAMTRGLKTYFQQQREHQWECARHIDLDGAVAGIIGFGGIGRRYATVAHAMGMRVMAVDRHLLSKPDSAEVLWDVDRLDQLLGAADVVLIACPYTPETHHLMNAARFARMKRSAILINIARGAIVDEPSLMAALRDGQIAGAGIDVCETEPLPSDSELWDVPNLLITPHCAGYAPGRSRRLAEFFCENLRRYLQHEPLLNVIDQQRGYPVPVQ